MLFMGCEQEYTGSNNAYYEKYLMLTDEGSNNVPFYLTLLIN